MESQLIIIRADTRARKILRQLIIEHGIDLVEDKLNDQTGPNFLKTEGNTLNRYPDLHKIGAILDEIRYIKIERNYCLVYTSHGVERIFRASLKAVLTGFDGKPFLQIHRSYCINPKFLTGIVKIGRNWRALCEDYELPISRLFLKPVRAALRGF